MQTTAMNSMFMPAGRSEAKATGKAGSEPFFGAVLSGRQAADNAHQQLTAGQLKTNPPVEKGTEATSFPGLKALSGISLDDLSQLQNDGTQLDPAALQQLQALLTKLTEQLNQAGLDGEGWLAELDFSAVGQGLDQFSESSPDGRQWLEQLQEQLMSKLDQLDWSAMVKPGEGMRQQQDGLVLPEQLLERLEPADLAALQKQISSVLEGEDSASLKDQLVRLQEQLEEAAVAEPQVAVGESEDLSDLRKQLAAVLEGEDSATLKDRLGSLQEQLQSLNKPPQGLSQEEGTQLRKQLQQQINTVAQQLQQTAEAAGQAREHSLRQNREELDPRFANLIRPQGEQDSQKESSSGQQKAVGEQDKLVQSELKMAGHSNKAIESLLHQLTTKQQHQGQQGNIVPQVQGQGNAPQAATPAPVMPMATGQTAPDSQIFDQVVTRMAGSFNGESGRMTLRLHPAELGSLKLDLQVEGQTIRAHLQAQTTQVQEVLERNLPQLRQALAEQGLKIDQFQVNLEQRQQGEQFADLQRHWNGGDSQPAEQLELAEEEQVVPLAHLLQNGGAGISLHV